MVVTTFISITLMATVYTKFHIHATWCRHADLKKSQILRHAGSTYLFTSRLCMLWLEGLIRVQKKEKKTGAANQTN
jgi:hypothetical protein